MSPSTISLFVGVLFLGTNSAWGNQELKTRQLPACGTFVSCTESGYCGRGHLEGFCDPARTQSNRQCHWPPKFTGCTGRPSIPDCACAPPGQNKLPPSCPVNFGCTKLSQCTGGGNRNQCAAYLGRPDLDVCQWPTPSATGCTQNKGVPDCACSFVGRK